MKYILPILLLLQVQFSFAQILSDSDKEFFQEHIMMPLAAPTYHLSFSASDLDLDTPMPVQEKAPAIQQLLDDYEKDPSDFDLVMRIADYYKNQGNTNKTYRFLENAFKIVGPQSQAHSDSFEVLDKVCEIYITAGQGGQAKTIWKDYITKKPKDVRGYSRLAMQEALHLELADAKQHINQAFELDKNHEDTYIAALMVGVMETMQGLSKAMQAVDRTARLQAVDKIQLDDRFFSKAVKADAPPTAQMAWDGCQLLIVMYKTILNHVDADIGYEVIQIAPSDKDKEYLAAIQQRANKQIKKGVKNPYFAYKVLTTIQILHGQEDEAKKIWEKSGPLLATDVEILRLLSLGHFLKMDFETAASFESKVIKITPTYEDYYTLGRFYHFMNKSKEAHEAFDKALRMNPNDKRAMFARMILFFKNNQWDAGLELAQYIDPQKGQNAAAPHAYYYQNLVLLLQGKRQEAIQKLKHITDESDYWEQIQELIKHFER